MRKFLGINKPGERLFQSIVTAAAIIILLLAFIPIILMLLLSFKSNVQIYGNFWSLPRPIQWDNYNAAVKMLIPNMLNSTIVVSVSVVFTVLLGSTAGYVFARLDFPGKKMLFMLVMSMMMVPGILTLTPGYDLIQQLHLKDTWFALFLPWIARGQVFGIILCRTFISGQPSALFESARLDGASELNAYYHIALPLARPILATLAIMKMVDYYNDFVWPLMVIDSSSKQVITVAIKIFNALYGVTDIGTMVAGFVFATIPLLLLFMAGSSFYIAGLTSGAVKV